MNSKENKEINWVADNLQEYYMDFSHYNRKNPLDELFFIIFSIMTVEKSYMRTFKAFKKKFPQFKLLATASVDEITVPLRSGGLARQKALHVMLIVDILIRQLGQQTLSTLKKLSDSQCELYLTSLSGVGIKVARCVMLFSLDRQVFPVDTHCWRVSRRLGWVKGYGDTPSDRDMNHLQNLIPAHLRYSMHVNMISLGRAVCKAVNPTCDICTLSKRCPKVGVENNS